MPATVPDLPDPADVLAKAGRRLDARGLAPATAGNYSARLADGTILITRSGAHKGRLDAAQFMRVAADGTAIDAGRSSAETLLHCLIYAVDPAAGAVLHTHSVAGTVLSRALAGRDGIALAEYELLKIFPGVATHEASVTLPLVDNSQDMPALAALLRPILLAQERLVPAFYIRGHGLYAWGPTLDAAEAMVEGCEFLLACAWEEMKLRGGGR
ncbi:methylthioribulose 1-phosphate dehydratase [Sphingobium fuliginis]|jgi:methylthioribulose-1-phosphate dehydratase|uniref:Methylthioribulose-1-phosphate dehydratase n=1 Tax=Sphingobium fuliginis (strain ATCC 27551) TaxID=336203 RepID=A0A7M2GPE6_SPHSA|nr:methylthioribulose 1-phosphate dehydratase [Sphingobium fuliginis]QOT73972.1 methylthioribulose 1-phosphate dehydratase [Sphingobium fuliginis]